MSATGKLETAVRESLGQIWENQAQLKAGLGSSEFNLRAHQKLLNALVVDTNENLMKLNDGLQRIGEKLELEMAEVKLNYVAVTEVELVNEDGDSRVVLRPDWAHYHQQVENDLAHLKELEEKKLEEERARLAEEAEEKADAPEGEAEVSEPGTNGDGVEAKEETPEPEEVQTPPPTSEDEFPEGANIFGGS